MRTNEGTCQRRDSELVQQWKGGLNAPTGAWCSLTMMAVYTSRDLKKSQCTYRCVVLPDCILSAYGMFNLWSQCTYRCVVLPDIPGCGAPPRPCLNAPTGAWCSLTHAYVWYIMTWNSSLNAPTGAWCSLTRPDPSRSSRSVRLNAPTGAWCSLTVRYVTELRGSLCLNAPTGAWCSLTPASESGGMTPLRGPGAPPAPGAPLRTGQHQAQTST